jgi:hypothetical protein
MVLQPLVMVETKYGQGRVPSWTIFPISDEVIQDDSSVDALIHIPWLYFRTFDLYMGITFDVY